MEALADVPERPWIAEQVVESALAATLIAEQLPDQFAGMTPERLALLGAGWDNTAYLVDGSFVFRFPRRAIAVPLLETETRLLPLLAARLPLAVPVPAYVGRPDARFPWPFAGYRLLPGRTACSADLDERRRLEAARPLGAFLRALHAVPAAEAEALGVPPDPVGKLDFGRCLPEALERLATLERQGVLAGVEACRRQLCETAVARPAPVMRLVHGDLYARHLLVDDGGALCGVIDWGDLHRGDPAVDLAAALSFLPPSGRAAFQAAYGAVDEETWRLARFRALYHAVATALYGHDVGDAALLRESLVALGHLGVM